MVGSKPLTSCRYGTFVKPILANSQTFCYTTIIMGLWALVHMKPDVN